MYQNVSLFPCLCRGSLLACYPTFYNLYSCICSQFQVSSTFIYKKKISETLTVIIEYWLVWKRIFYRVRKNYNIELWIVYLAFFHSSWLYKKSRPIHVQSFFVSHRQMMCGLLCIGYVTARRFSRALECKRVIAHWHRIHAAFTWCVNFVAMFIVHF